MCLSRLTLRLTQPSPRCRPSWLTHACEDQRHLKPPSLEKKKKHNTNTEHRTHTWCSKALPLIILKPHNYYLTSSSLGFTGSESREEFPGCRDENQMFCVHVDSCRPCRGDAAFSVVSKQFVQFGPERMGSCSRSWKTWDVKTAYCANRNKTLSVWIWKYCALIHCPLVLRFFLIAVICLPFTFQRAA